MTITRMEFDKLKQQVLNLLRELDSIGGLAEVLVTGADISVSQLSAISADMGSITAGTITGGTLRTAASGARVVLDSAGLKCYDATAQRGQILNDGSGWFGASTAFSWTSAGVVSIDGNKLNTGSVANGALAGGITYDKLSVTQLSAISANLGSITAGTITGGTLRTAATGARVVIDSTGIKWYDATTQRGQILNTGAGWLGSSTKFSWTSAGVVSIDPDRLTAGNIVNALSITTGNLVAGAVTLSSSGIVIDGQAAVFKNGAYLGYVFTDAAGDLNLYAAGKIEMVDPVLSLGLVTLQGGFKGSGTPSTDNTGNLGSASLRYALIRGVVITPGDLIFENEFAFVEDGPDGILLLNPDRIPIVRFDREGNIELAGIVKPNILSRGPIPRPVPSVATI